jgi:predicted outer membrane repeat protein
MKHFILSFILILAWNTAWSQLTVFVSTPTDGNGVGTLRSAVNLANINAGTVIRFDSSLDNIPINITQGQIAINEGVVIIGNGVGVTILDGQGTNECFLSDGKNVEISNITFNNFNESAPVSVGSGGAAIRHISGSLFLESCSFENNHSENNSGGAIFSEDDFLSVKKCSFLRNDAFFAGAISSSTDLEVSESIFHGNFGTPGTPSAVASTNNITIVSSVFQGNGRYYSHLGQPDSWSTFQFSGNQIEFDNCLITGNVGISFLIHSGATATITNCTVASNDNRSFSSLITTNSSFYFLRNNIMALNGTQIASQISYDAISEGGNIFDVIPVSQIPLHATDISGTSTYPLNPQFVSAISSALPSIGGNYKLKSCSKAVNAGLAIHHPQDVLDINNNGNIIEPLPTDLGQDPRVSISSQGFYPTVIDAGAYEFQGIPAACQSGPSGPSGLSLSSRTMITRATHDNKTSIQKIGDMYVLKKEENVSDIFFTLYPNPNNGEFTIQLNSNDSRIASYKIYDRMGFAIRNVKVENASLEMNIRTEGLERGFYTFEGVDEVGNMSKIRFSVK